MSRLDLIAGIPGIDALGLTLGGIEDLVRRALAEDLAGGIDVTSAATIGPDQLGRASAVPRRPGVVAGIPVAAAVFALVSEGRVSLENLGADGAAVVPGDVLLTQSARCATCSPPSARR
jgi:nicotinate-nucleotide pyrophosphorylase (carboxylating)